MHFSRSLNVVGVHAEGEVGDVIVGGVMDVPGKTMYDKMIHFWTKNDGIRKLLLNEPRGRSSMCSNLVLPPCNPKADAGFLILECEEWVPMSGSNTICTTTVLLETGMLPMQEPITQLNLDTAAGLVHVTAECENGKCKSVEFDNVAAFVFALDHEVHVPDLGPVKVDIAYGGMIYALVDVESVGQKIEDTGRNGACLVELGERIKKAVRESPIHPENPAIRGVTNLVFTSKLVTDEAGKKSTTAATVVLPGRLDRSPCGTGTCARLAAMHARGELKEGEALRVENITGTEFHARIRGTCKVGNYNAVLPSVKGRAWITSFKQVVLDPSDPFPEGFRVSDAWHTKESLSLGDVAAKAHAEATRQQ